jgi:L-Ala-D/L-Glu epimerase / N-acetyl-D-glutamate racemase
MHLRIDLETVPFTSPVRITGHTFHEAEIVVVRVGRGDRVGRGEAAGVYYRDETPRKMLEQLESLRSEIEKGVDRESIQKVMPPGGARNAIDCALWDLEAQETNTPAWKRAGLDEPHPLLTTFTIGAGDPALVAAKARSYGNARALKLKLLGDGVDADRVRAARAARPEVWLGVDANQGFTRSYLEEIMPALEAARVQLIEQPLPVGDEHQLDGFESPIPIAADESMQGLSDIAGLLGRFSVANIKLDKCGGLTEALAMARELKTAGLIPMVGCMSGTSLSMAPAFLVGQLCGVVDLDAPICLEADRLPSVSYVDGEIHCPAELWGNAG